MACVCRRRVLLVLGGGKAVALIVAGVVALLAAAWLVAQHLSPDLPRAVVADEAGMAKVRERLGPVVTVLSAVPSPAHTRPAAPAELVGCSVDSGELFEPSVYREWELKGDARSSDPNGFTASARGRVVASSVARSLIARGWIGRPALDRDAATFLRGPDRHTWVTVQAYADRVVAYGETRHEKVCGLTRE